MTEDNFNAIKLRSQRDLIIDENNVLETCLNLGKMYNNYLIVYSTEIRTLKDMNIELDKRYGDLYHKYKYGKEFDYALNNKGEVDVYINNDPSYYEYNKFVKFQEVVVKFLEYHLECLSKMSYTIKNYIELKKIKLGVM